MTYAVDQPQDFREIYRADVPTDTSHWHCNAHREIRLSKPAEVVYVGYVGDPALNNFHIYAHCLDDGRSSAQPVTITHAWREPSGPKSQTVTLQQPGPYRSQPRVSRSASRSRLPSPVIVASQDSRLDESADLLEKARGRDRRRLAAVRRAAEEDRPSS